MKKIISLPMAALVLSLAACGGGGGGGDAPAGGSQTLSVTQKNFEAATLNDYWIRFDWNVPTTNVAPTTGTHYFYGDKFNSPASPSTGAQDQGGAAINFATTLALPNLTQKFVSRKLKSGVIYVSNHDSKATWTYSGSDVLSNGYAADGLTLLTTTDYDTWSSPIALTGQIGATTILKSFLGFTKLNTPVNLDFSASWLPGSTYFTRKGYQKNDTLYLLDWTGRTYTSAVTPYAGTETTIEAYFANSSIATAGGFTYDNVLYNFASGTVGVVEGARSWIANAKRPTSASPTDEYVTLTELNGKIYFGVLEKAGTRFKYVDGVDSTIINDYNIRLNSTAATSMKAAVKF